MATGCAAGSSGTSVPTAPEPPETAAPAVDTIRSVRVGTVTRRYLLHRPRGLDAQGRVPVVLAFHGGGGNPQSMVALSGLNAKADVAGFIVAYPYGTGVQPDANLSFNGGGCCAVAMMRGVDDVAFTRAILDDLATVVAVDADRVHATGLSNGGIMVHYLASELADRIASIAAVGGPLMVESPRASRPVAVMHVHGTADELAPYDGGFGRSATGGPGVTNFRSVAHTVDAWRARIDCGPTALVDALPDVSDDAMRTVRTRWAACAAGTEVVQLRVEGGGHTWPGMAPPTPFLGPSTRDFAVNDVLWEFFQRHPRR